MGVNSPGTYLDIFGFDNAPESTNLPQIYEREVTIFGNRTLTGFLRMIGSEMPTMSQQIRWAEQRRLHVYYNRVVRVGAAATASDGSGSTTGNFLAVHESDVAPTADNDLNNHAIRVGDKILVGPTDQSVAAELFIVSGKHATTGNITVDAY